MSEHTAENTGCLLVAEYVDDSGAATEAQVTLAQDVGTNVVASYIDIGVVGAGVRDFTILLKDDRIVSVRGDGLRLFASPVPGGGGSYGVITHADGEEVLVALFSIPEVVGIFSGEIRADRKIA